MSVLTVVYLLHNDLGRDVGLVFGRALKILKEEGGIKSQTFKGNYVHVHV